MTYTAFALSGFQTAFAYRAQVWAGLLGQAITMLAFVAIWTSVYGGARSVEGVTLSEMITYAVLATPILTAWRWRQMLARVDIDIRSGDIAVLLLKPIRYPLMLFAQASGTLCFELLMVGLPVTLLIALLYGLVPPASLFHGLMFLGYFVMSFAIMFLIAAIGALIAFWFHRAESLEYLIVSLLGLLSGQFVPLWFFPYGLGVIVAYLPFAWISFHPCAVYLGKYGVTETLVTFGIGLGWVVLLAGLVALLWRHTTHRVTAQGG